MKSLKINCWLFLLIKLVIIDIWWMCKHIWGDKKGEKKMWSTGFKDMTIGMLLEFFNMRPFRFGALCGWAPHTAQELPLDD